MAYFLNRNFAFTLAILTNFKAGLQLNTTLERKNTSVQPNITLEVTTIENEDQLTRIDLFSLRELCIFSVVISPACLVVSLYQTFIISLHRHLTIIGSPWGRILFEEKRHYVWYVGGWIMIVAPLSILISPMRNETDRSFMRN